MKRIILSFIICHLSFSSVAAQNDTLVINHPDKVTIISGDSLQQVIVSGKPGDRDFTYQNTLRIVDANYESNTSISRDRWELIPSVKVKERKSTGGGSSYYSAESYLTAHIGVGFTCPTNADSRIDFSTFRSWEIFATVLQMDQYLNRYGRDVLSIGFGIDWKNYRITDDLMFTKDLDGNVTLDRFPMEYEPKFSRIKVFSLTGTIRYEHNFGHGFSIGFGPVVNFNTYASIKTRYKFMGDKCKRMEKNIRQRPITLDWMLNAHIGGFPLYVKYSNDDVLKDGGVKFRSLSFGIYL